MRIQYCSDLHLEFRENKEFLKLNPLQPKGDILLLAGDIVPFAVMHKHSDFFDYVSDHFKATYWLPGNHEYYHSDIAEKSGPLNEKIRKNVFLVNNFAITHSEIKLIFSTLWTKISPVNQWAIQQGMSDFHVIRHNDQPFTPLHCNQLNEDSIQFIQQEINQEKSIVITHHVPTFLNYPLKHKGDIFNEAFAVELHDLIESSLVDYWIYGHNHEAINSFSIGRTRLITNQLGYVKFNEHVKYNSFALVDV